MNNLTISPYIFMYALQVQNIRRKSNNVKKMAIESNNNENPDNNESLNTNTNTNLQENIEPSLSENNINNEINNGNNIEPYQ